MKTQKLQQKARIFTGYSKRDSNEAEVSSVNKYHNFHPEFQVMDGGDIGRQKISKLSKQRYILIKH